MVTTTNATFCEPLVHNCFTEGFACLVISQVKINEAIIAEKMSDNSEPMSYYRAFKDVVTVLPKDAVIVRVQAASVSTALNGLLCVCLRVTSLLLL